MKKTAARKRIPLLDLQGQYKELRGELLAAAERVLDSGRYILGDEGRLFETEFAAAQGLRFCAGVSSGTQAIELALEALGVGPGDEVALPALTFIATATSVSALGAKPVFVDVDAERLTLDAADLRRRVTKKTKAVIPVHLYGRAADMDAVMAAARAHKLFVVEDCAQAHLARWKGRAVGDHGDLGAFSFYPSKNLGALGDAGAVSSSSAELDEKVRMLRNVGRLPGRQYEHAAIGRNYRLDELQAAFMRVKLKRLAEWTRRRQAAAARYEKNLSGLPLTLPPKDARGTESSNHLFVVQSERRDALAKHLEADGIASAVYYPQPLHLQAAYKSFGGKPGDLPEAERASTQVLALPMYPELSAADCDRVCDSVKEFFGRG